MKKSAQEFESLIRTRDLLKDQLVKEIKHYDFINMFSDLSNQPETKMPDSLMIMSRVTKRISDAKSEIINEELKIVEEKIAEYNNIFTSAAG